MVEIIAAEKLYVPQVDEILKNSFINTAQNICINLKKVKFFDPYAIVCLAGLARYLKSKNCQATFIFSDTSECVSYLSYMKFFDYTKGYITINNVKNFETSSDSNDVLIKLTQITKDNNSINKILEKILKNQLNFSEKEIADFSIVISELCYNIIDHSEDEGLLAVQSYTNSAGKKFVKIAVADLGIGIKAGLEKRYNDFANLSHFEAIKMALKKEVSSLVDRGLGLFKVYEITKQYNGRLHIRSGDTCFHFRGKNINNYSVGMFSGVQILISLEEKTVSAI